MRNAPIPSVVLPEKAQDFYSKYEFRDSVSTAENALEKTEGVVWVSTGDLAVVLGGNVYQGYNCVQCWAEFSTTHLNELLNSVRNRVLDFALVVQNEAPTAGQTRRGEEPVIAPTRVTQIFRTTVYGGAANIVGSAENSPVTFNIGVKDFTALEKVLIENGVAATDVTELKTALESDPAPSKLEELGPRVSAWIGKMVGKAAAGGWNIGAGAAGNLLADLLAQYYGLK